MSNREHDRSDWMTGVNLLTKSPHGSGCDLDLRDLFSERTPPCRDDNCPTQDCSRPAETLFNLDHTAWICLLLLHPSVLTCKNVTTNRTS